MNRNDMFIIFLMGLFLFFCLWNRCALSVGYEISEDDVIAIARLRGHSLKSYNIPHCCICTVEEEEEHISWFSHGCYAPEFPQKVS